MRGLLVLVCLYLLPFWHAAPAFGSTLYINEIMADNGGVLLDEDGDEPDWIELYNNSAAAVSLSGWHLTDNPTNLTQWTFPSTNIPAQGFLVVFASDKNRAAAGGELHANFKLSAAGEYIALVQPEGTLVEYDFSFPAQLENISWGRGFSAGTGMLAAPTPEAPNTEVSYVGFCDPPLIGPERGFYDAPVLVSITNVTDEATVRYTTDGSLPTASNGSEYSGPITVSGTTLLRAAAFRVGFQPSAANTQTYLFIADVLQQDGSGLPPYGYWGHSGPDWEVDPAMVNSVISDFDGRTFTLADALLDIPTVSLVTDWDYWWSNAAGPVLPDGVTPWLGIYADSVGQNAVRRPVSMEFFTADGSEEFSVDGRVSIVGGGIGGTSAFRWKTDKLSMRVAFTDKLDYPVFGEDAAQKFNGLVLDAHLAWTWTHHASHIAPKYIVEAVATDMLNSMDGNTTQHDRFVHLYLNGMYWGLYDMHERPDEHFASEYFGGQNEDYDSIKHWADDTDSRDSDHDGDPYNDNITNGDDADYRAMLTLSRADLSQQANYDTVSEHLDIEGLIDYVLMNFFVGNIDWAHKNWYATHNYTDPAGRWRYHAWDTEHLMEVDDYSYSNPDLSTAVNADLTGRDNYGGPTEVHHNLAANEEYRLLFADHIHRHLFNDGALTTTGFASVFWGRLREVQWAMQGEAARWGDNRTSHDYDHWRNHMQDILDIYLPYRRDAVLNQLMNRGLYPQTAAPEFEINGSRRHGGLIAPGDEVTMDSSYTVYFTTDGSDPRAVGGAVAGTQYIAPLSLHQPTMVRARAKNGNEWSALCEAVFFPEKSPLAVTELMYHASSNQLDFIEIRNISNWPVNLYGYKLDKAVSFDFGAATLGPGEYLVAIKDINAFSVARATNGIPIAGEYKGDFDNSGEKVDLEFWNHDLISFRYSDARNWPQAADGAGHSLVPRDFAMLNEASGALDCGGNWRASTYSGGSPGFTDPVPPSGVLLNEITAHTDTGEDPPFESNDRIELFNPTASDITLNGWYLSDDPGELQKWAIPDGTVVPAQGFALFDEDDFHPDRVAGFGLNKAGEEVVLSTLDRVVDAIRFKGQENGASLGRFPDGADDWLVTDPSPNAPNRLANPDMWIGGLMYNPPAPAGYQDGDAMEYIQLENRGTSPVLFETAAGPWRIDGGVDYSFPAGFSLPAGEKLWLVPFDPSDSTLLNLFCSTYGLTAVQETFLGPYRGRLSNRGERVAIERPQKSDDPLRPLDISWVVVDELFYFNQAPWPDEADGTGYPLVRTSMKTWGVPTPSDTDADLLDDAWEYSCFGSLSQNGGDDPDNDRFSNLEERICGTNPTNGLSYFVVDAVNAATIEWIPAEGRSYSIYWTEDLQQPFTQIAWGIEHPQNSFTDSRNSTGRSGYYYIAVERK